MSQCNLDGCSDVIDEVTMSEFYRF